MEPTSQYGTFDNSSNIEIDDTKPTSIIETRVSKCYLLSERDFNRSCLTSTLDCTFGGIASVVSGGCLVYSIYAIVVNGEGPNQLLINAAALTLAQGMMYLGRGVGAKNILWDTKERNIPIQYV
jgi:hypothetical protein